MSNSFVTLWTVSQKIPLSMGFPMQEYWSGLPFPFTGHIPDPGIKLESPVSPALQVDPILLSHLGSPWKISAAAESRQSCLTLCNPRDGSQAPPSLGFSRQEHWSGLPFPSPMHGSEK